MTSFEPVDLSSSTHTPHHHLPGGRLGGEIVEMAISRRPNRRLLGMRPGIRRRAGIRCYGKSNGDWLACRRVHDRAFQWGCIRQLRVETLAGIQGGAAVWRPDPKGERAQRQGVWRACDPTPFAFMGAASIVSFPRLLSSHMRTTEI